MQLLQKPCVLVYLSVLTLPPCSAVSNSPPPCSTAYNNLLNFWQCCACSGCQSPQPLLFHVWLCVCLFFVPSMSTPLFRSVLGQRWKQQPFLFPTLSFFATEFEGFPSRSPVSPVRTWPRTPSCHFPIPSPFPDQYFQDRFLFLSSYVFLMPSSVTESLIDLRARGPDLAFVHENTVEHTCHLMQRSAPLLLSLCSGFLSVNMMKTL